MKAIITVIGKDTVGILAKVSDACAKASVNIIEVTQSVLQDMFDARGYRQGYDRVRAAQRKPERRRRVHRHSDPPDA